ncbi:MAG: hypothetical protein LBD59_05875 [Prevotellaceae bacterium]|nr:hypothetical protein [Prevotellaceae bacterium]
MTQILWIGADFFICNHPLNLRLLDHNHAGGANTFAGAGARLIAPNPRPFVVGGVRARLIAPLHGANTRPANTFVGVGAGRALPLHRRNQYDAFTAATNHINHLLFGQGFTLSALSTQAVPASLLCRQAQPAKINRTRHSPVRTEITGMIFVAANNPANPVNLNKITVQTHAAAIHINHPKIIVQTMAANIHINHPNHPKITVQTMDAGTACKHKPDEAQPRPNKSEN